MLWALWCFHFWIDFIILAGNKYNHKSLIEFEFLPDPFTNYWVSCPWAFEKWMYDVVSTLASSFVIGFYTFLDVTRTVIKAWMGLRLGKILLYHVVCIMQWQWCFYLQIALSCYSSSPHFGLFWISLIPFLDFRHHYSRGENSVSLWCHRNNRNPLFTVADCWCLYQGKTTVEPV